MTWKSNIQLAVSTTILLVSLLFLGLVGAYSTGHIDLASEPVVNAEENTTGVPEVKPSQKSVIEGRNLERVIFQKVNKQRKRHGVDPLTHSERVRLIARLHSHDMGNRDFYSHTNPDGFTPPDRHEKYNGCERPNENLVEWKNLPFNNTSKIASGVVSSWLNSTGHNTTMMSDYYHVSAVGVYVTENRTLYVTQNFCREHPNA